MATEIDSDSTYIDGSDECVQALLNSPDLEVLPADIEDRIDSVGDPGDLKKSNFFRNDSNG